MNDSVDRKSARAVFARSLLIQGSWNHATMLGCGFAFAMLPALRRIYTSSEDLSVAVGRHLEHFNAHPYLSGIALGGSIKLEGEGAEADTIRRFKVAVRGPSGSLGDALVWVTWLPLVALAALSALVVGVPVLMVVIAYIVVFNLGHVGLRGWAFRAGLRSGHHVGSELAEANLMGWTRRLQSPLLVLIGMLLGLWLAAPNGVWAAGPEWASLVVGAFLVGFAGGHRSWRPAAVVVVTIVLAIAAWGMFA